MPSTSSFAISNAASTLRGGHAVEHQVFFADPRVSDEAVLSVAIEAAGLANNVNHSEAAIMASIARLDEVGVAHTDAGANWAFARAPAIVRREGCASALCSTTRSIGRIFCRLVGTPGIRESSQDGGLPAGPADSRCFPECRPRETQRIGRLISRVFPQSRA